MGATLLRVDPFLAPRRARGDLYKALTSAPGRIRTRDPLLRRSVCAAGQPACSQVSRYLGLSGSNRKFPALTGRSGTQRARACFGEHLIRRSGQLVQDRPSPVVGWADVPELSRCVGCCSAPWLQCRLQSRRNGADPPALVVFKSVRGSPHPPPLLPALSALAAGPRQARSSRVYPASEVLAGEDRPMSPLACSSCAARPSNSPRSTDDSSCTQRSRCSQPRILARGDDCSAPRAHPAGGMRLVVFRIEVRQLPDPLRSRSFISLSSAFSPGSVFRRRTRES